jgi:hypothetical protein
MVNQNALHDTGRRPVADPIHGAYRSISEIEPVSRAIDHRQLGRIL